MATLTVVANIKAKADKIRQANSELKKRNDITRAEEGYINYDLHQDNEDPSQFFFPRTGNHGSCGKCI